MASTQQQQHLTKRSKFHVDIDTDIPVEPTLIWDYIVLGGALFFTIYGIIIIIILTKNRNAYLPLKTKNVPNLVIIIVAGIMHVWGTFLANDHIEAFRYIKHIDCTLWSYVLQYALGLNIWFSAILYRCTSYGLLFGSMKPGNCFANRDKIRILLMVALSLPICTICLLVFILNGSVYSEEMGTCMSKKIWKGAVLLWIVMGLIVLALFTLFVRNRVTDKFYDESKIMKGIAKWSILIITFNAAISFSEFINFSLGRSFFTLNIIFLHFYADSRMMLDLTIKTIRKQYELLEGVKKTFDSENPFDISTIDPELIFELDQECLEFVCFVGLAPSVPSDTVALMGIEGDNVLLPKRIGELLLTIKRFKATITDIKHHVLITPSQSYKGNPLLVPAPTQKHSGKSHHNIIDHRSSSSSSNKKKDDDDDDDGLDDDEDDLILTEEDQIRKAAFDALKLYLDATPGIPTILRSKFQDSCTKLMLRPRKIGVNSFSLIERWIHMVLCTGFLTDYIKSREGKFLSRDFNKDTLLTNFRKVGYIGPDSISQREPYYSYDSYDDSILAATSLVDIHGKIIPKEEQQNFTV